MLIKCKQSAKFIETYFILLVQIMLNIIPNQRFEVFTPTTQNLPPLEVFLQSKTWLKKKLTQLDQLILKRCL